MCAVDCTETAKTSKNRTSIDHRFRRFRQPTATSACHIIYNTHYRKWPELDKNPPHTSTLRLSIKNSHRTAKTYWLILVPLPHIILDRTKFIMNHLSISELWANFNTNIKCHIRKNYLSIKIQATRPESRYELEPQSTSYIGTTRNDCNVRSLFGQVSSFEHGTACWCIMLCRMLVLCGVYSRRQRNICRHTAAINECTGLILINPRHRAMVTFLTSSNHFEQALQYKFASNRFSIQFTVNRTAQLPIPHCRIKKLRQVRWRCFQVSQATHRASE